MGRKKRAMTQDEKECKMSKSQEIHKGKRQAFLRKLQEITMSHRDSDDASCTLLHKENRTRAFSYPERASTSNRLAAKSRDEDTGDEKCYRCKHFLQIPQNLSRAFCKRTSSSIARCEIDLSFVQALVWLKSAIVCAPQIPVERLRWIFNRQWRTLCDETEDIDNAEQFVVNKKRPMYDKDTVKDIEDVRHAEQSGYVINEERSTYDKDVKKDAVVMPSISPNISDETYVITPESIDEPCAGPEDTQNDAINDGNESLIDIFLTQEGCSQDITQDGRRVSPTNFFTVLQEDARQHLLDVSSETFGTPDMFNTSTECQIADLQSTSIRPDPIRSGETRLGKSTSRNINDISFEQTNEDTARNAIITRNKSTPLGSHFDSGHVFTTPERRTVFRDEQHSSISSATNQFIDYGSNLRLLLNSNMNIFTPIQSHSKLYDESPPTFNLDTLKDLVIIQMDISQNNSETTICKRQSDDKFRDRIFSNIFNDNERQFDDQFDNLDGSDTRTNVIEYDTACSAPNVDVHNNNTGIKSIARKTNKSMSDGNIGHRYNLRSYKKRTTTHEKETTNSFSTIIKKPECTRIRSNREKENNEETISAAWLNFTLESLDVDDVILGSLKVILSTLGDKSIAEVYEKRRHWKGTLEEEALSAVLNVSDIFRIEKKPDICRREIVTMITKTLDEMAMCVELNKTSVWIYRVDIILELCNSLSICVEIIDHLIAKLKLFPSILIDVMNIRRNTHDQLHLIFYALDIALRKYRTMIPNDKRSNFAEAAIPHVADLWKMRYMDENLEKASLNLDTMEERWAEALEQFTVMSTNHFVQYAEKSSSLFRVLISE